MIELNDLHEQAMEAADGAFIAKRRGNQNLANQLYRRAFTLERSVVDQLKDTAIEPSRSILYRSAAALAIEAGELAAAEQLVATALAGNPPPEIADELRDLFDQVNFHRHLALRGTILDPGELQVTIAGNAVAGGLTLSDVFVDRLRNLERVIYRTAERLLGKEFRERGAVKSSIDAAYSLWVSAPRAGSFAVTLRVGRQRQLPGIDLEVLDEVVECFTLLNGHREELLRQRIPQEPYYRNFVELAKRVAPDGNEVNLVGLTSQSNGQEKKLALTRSRQDIAETVRTALVQEGDKDRSKVVSVTGRLKIADASGPRGMIVLIDEENKKHRIQVPEGMLNDIVRPLWDERVTVSGVHQKNTIRLDTIDPVLD